MREPGRPFSLWRFCLPRQDDKGVELTEVVAKVGDSDSSSQEVERESMQGAQPTWRTKWQFDPSVHLTLDETGLHPNFHNIVNSSASEEQIAQRLNHAKQYCAAAPFRFPSGFDPAKHVRQDGQPDIPAILNDDSLNPRKVDIYRAAKAYVPGTCSDPVYARMAYVGASMPVAFAILVTGMLLVAVYTNRGKQDAAPCQNLLTNDTEAEAFLQAVRQELSNLCASASQALEPLLFTWMLIGVLAFAT